MFAYYQAISKDVISTWRCGLVFQEAWSLGVGGDVAGDRNFSVAADLANTWICG